MVYNDPLGFQFSVLERIIINHFRRIIINLERQWRFRLYSVFIHCEKATKFEKNRPLDFEIDK